ncbi:NAD(P)-binding protein [bacterium]|nr:NAD(P)-binding protein [bacterium]
MKLPAITDVAIIGAGISGLTVARHCHDTGIPYIVLEATGRIGGRVHTVHHNHCPIDLGASWLHSGDVNPLREDALKAGCKLEPTDTTLMVWQDGAWLDEEGYRRYITPYEATRRDIVATTGQIDTNNEQYISGGAEKLITRWADGLAIEQNCPVSHIEWSADGALVQTAQGPCRAKHVVLAVNANVIRQQKITFLPTLPDTTQKIFASLIPVTLQKLVLLLEKPLPPHWRNHYLIHADHPQWILFAPPELQAITVLYHHFGDELPPAHQTMQEHGIAILAEWLGYKPSVDHSLYMNWQTDPWQGCTHFWPMPADSVSHLQKPFGPIHFAGDYLSVPWAGQMSGAYARALEICTKLKGS